MLRRKHIFGPRGCGNSLTPRSMGSVDVCIIQIAVPAVVVSVSAPSCQSSCYAPAVVPAVVPVTRYETRLRCCHSGSRYYSHPSINLSLPLSIFVRLPLAFSVSIFFACSLARSPCLSLPPLPKAHILRARRMHQAQQLFAKSKLDLTRSG